MLLPPKNSGELRPYKDRVFIYVGVDRGGWKPQLSVLNCNKPRIWELVTENRNATFHYLERKEGKEKVSYIFLPGTGEWVIFDVDVHTPSW